MENLSHANANANANAKASKLKKFDLSYINIDFMAVVNAMESGKVLTVIDSSTGEPCLITEKMYKQLLDS